MMYFHCRLAATEVMKRLESAYHIEEDPYSKINLVDLISKGGGEREIKLAQSTSFIKSSEYSSLKHQIEAIKVVNYIIVHDLSF